MPDRTTTSSSTTSSLTGDGQRIDGSRSARRSCASRSPAVSPRPVRPIPGRRRSGSPSSASARTPRWSRCRPTRPKRRGDHSAGDRADPPAHRSPQPVAQRSGAEDRSASSRSAPAAIFSTHVTLHRNDRAADDVLNRLGRRRHGDLESSPDRRPASRPALHAIDGDPTTAWTSPFSNVVGSTLQVPLDPEVSTSSLMIDPAGRRPHSTITRVVVTIGNQTMRGRRAATRPIRNAAR